MNKLHRAVSDRILAELKAGAAPWLQPWKVRRVRGAAPIAIPRNAVTGRRYSGANVFLLWMTASDRGWSDGRFLTFKQAIEAGGAVRKGEHGSKVYFVSYVDRTKEGADGQEELRRVPFLKEYTVFNISQCDGLPERLTAAAAPAPIAEAETPRDEFAEFVDASRATITLGGDRAFFRPATDTIHLPELGQFTSLEHFRATLAHELVHWTGADRRLDRTFGRRFGDQAYAAEELVAELGAALICAEFGLEADLRHAGYIEHWIKLLTDHEAAFFAAASAASRAVDYLRDLALAEAAAPEAPAPIAEATPAGAQFVLPGAERRQAPSAKQLDLLF